jgi:uncharacterized protein (DUF2267 family)
MATTGLEVFDRTLHTTNLWLDEISAEIGPDRHLAWHVLGAVLRSIRDEMLVEQSAHFAAQLPLLVRGAYFDQYRPAAQPASGRSQEEFIARIQHDLHGARPVNTEQAVSAVTRTLNRHVTEGQVKKVRDSLPKGVRALWPEPGHDGGAGQQKSDQSAKSGQGQSARGGADPARPAGQPASGGQRQPEQHAGPQHGAAPPQQASAPPQSAPQAPAPQHTEPPRPSTQHTDPPRPTPQQHAAPLHSASQQSLRRPAHDERVEITEERVEMIEEADEERPSIGTSSSRPSSGRSPQVPIGPSSRPPAVHAAPSTGTTTGDRKAKTRAKRSTDE